MLYLNLPVGANFGWGVCGKYVARELSRLTAVQLVAPQFDFDTVGDELDFFALARLLPPPALLQSLAAGQPHTFPGPLLQGIRGPDLLPIQPHIKGTPTIGYTFFEDNLLPPTSLENARRHFAHITTGCSWCTRVLTELGLTNVSTILQGIDPAIFHPLAGPRAFFPDHFIVFSGGKLEYRKGHDIVIRAVKVLQDRHKDVLLINSWYNMWQHSLDTLRASPLIRFAPRSNNYLQAIAEILSDNCVDLARTITLLPRPNATLASIYRNTDVGLFPNRCEGGTNLVLMEYMATGKTVVATASTGHADVVSPDNARIISTPTSTTVLNAQRVPIAQWPEPDLDHTIEQLEWAYQHRDALAPLAARAAADLANLTWSHTAAEFLKVINSLAPPSR